MSAARAALDRALALKGTPIRLERIFAAGFAVSVNLRGVVSGYLPHDIVGSLQDGDLKVVLSPTDLDQAQWPGGAPTDMPDRHVMPRRGDRVYVDGRGHQVQAVNPFFVGSDLVRIELTIR